MEFLVN